MYSTFYYLNDLTSTIFETSNCKLNMHIDKVSKYNIKLPFINLKDSGFFISTSRKGL